MNRNRYRLVFNPAAGMMVPVAETARRHGKTVSGPALALAGVVLCCAAHAGELPVPSAGGAIPNFVTAGQASYQTNGNQAYVNQVGDKSILNWQSFNISPGHNVQFRQVDNLNSNNPVAGANFTSLNRVWDMNPSVIAGSISQAAGQKANVILVNSNGIAFMGGSQVNLNQFTASTLNVLDDYVGNLTSNITTPQFEKALDGVESRGFIKVMPGARISATDSGRVMLIAPTVVNKGTVEASDGQVIMAAGSKAYLTASTSNNLRGLLIEVESPNGLNSFITDNAAVKDGLLDGKIVALANPAEDKLGHVANLGELSTPRGNVTMVGYAVNQKGIARATTSVVANGSVYLMAKDTFSLPSVAASSTRTGQVTFGAGSVTKILPEKEDRSATQDTVADGVANSGLDQASRVLVLGQDIRVEGDKNNEDAKVAGAMIRAPAGEVSFYAIEANTGNTVRNLVDERGLLKADTPVSSSTRVHFGEGARIDLAGMENVKVSAERNVQEVELRGDELKDSPVNRDSPLRGEKVHVNVERALARAEAGQSTLIAKDRLQSLQLEQKRTVMERSTKGGKVEVYSQGEAIIEPGVSFDVSGGSLQYAPANIKTTLLSQNGKLVDISDANAEDRYDGIATRYVIDYGRWNVKKVIDLGQSYQYDPGYIEGKNAGSVSVFGMGGTVISGPDLVVGRTITGDRQREAGVSLRGAQLTVGFDDATNADINKSPNGYQDYKLNHQVEITSTAAVLPAGFKFGDPLPEALKKSLALHPGLMGEGKIAELAVYANQAVALREALAAPGKGAVTIRAPEVNIGKNIDAAAIDVAATYAKGQTALPASPVIELADEVKLSARGKWVNDLPGYKTNAATSDIDGGFIKLNAETLGNGPQSYLAQGKIVFGKSVVLDADGGGWLKQDGTLVGGDGGGIDVATYSLSGWENADAHAYGMDKGGSLSLGADRVLIGDTPTAARGTVNLDAGFFRRGGFANYAVRALSSLDVADSTQIKTALVNRELTTTDRLRPSGTPVGELGRLTVLDDRLHRPVGIELSSKLDSAQTGDLRIGKGAVIESDPKAAVTIEAYRMADIEGRIATTGGNIKVKADKNFGTVWLGDSAQLDASGSALTYTDNKGLTQGEVLAGGQVTLNAGNVVTRKGSAIDVSGAAPVVLGMPDDSGRLGRAVGSDAGTLSVSVNNKAILDGGIDAHAGGASNRGGVFDMTYGVFKEPEVGQPLMPAVLEVAQTATEQSTDLKPGDWLNAKQTILAAGKIEAAGFDRVRLSSRDAICLQDGLNMGAGRSLPLRELTLDAASVQTSGGDSALTAETVRIGNYHPGRRAATTAETNSGTLKVEARQLELAGKLSLEGMARAELSGEEEIRLAGVSVDNKRPAGELKVAADLLMHGALIAPTTYSLYIIDASGHAVTFTRPDRTPLQPLFALGSLNVRAQDITQAGSLWSPFGSIDLQATGKLVYDNGSLTSVAAKPGSLIPFGKIDNGRDWTFEVDATAAENIPIAKLEDKAIRSSGATVDMRPGAKIDLSGGGDIQAYEFTVGPGGSRDILADANIYAILPGYAGGYAAVDAQEDQSRAVGEPPSGKVFFNRASGEAVYLSGVPGLKDGVYTLLPAHYALLPGAYAVKLNTGIKDILPGQAYSRQDGVRIAAGYVTDTRDNAPRDARWQGVEVMTHEQVRARSEFTLTKASQFFADGRSRPQDAGLLSVKTTGTGADALKLDATFGFSAASGGRGAKLDLDAQKIAIISGGNAATDVDAVMLDAAKLNALGAESLFIGGTRSRTGELTTLTVGAEDVTLANDAGHVLKAGEIMLAAKDTLTLKTGSAIDAQGDAGNAGDYVTAGDGAFVRAAATSAAFSRTGSPDRSHGALAGEAGSTLVAADSITLDATKQNNFKGTTRFEKNGQAIAGNLAVGATRINFGSVPADAEGLGYSQQQLDNFATLNTLALTSYSNFDLYGGVTVGKLGADGSPLLQNLTLHGAGLMGLDNAGKTAQINAKNLSLANPVAATFSVAKDANGNEAALGTGDLSISADTLTLGKGDKRIEGFGAATVTANELVGSGKGELEVKAPLTLNVARISGKRGADQTLNSTAALTVVQHTVDRVLAPVSALGAKWALHGSVVDFDSRAELPSGGFKLTATQGDVKLNEHARVDVAGRGMKFFDVIKPSWGGTAEFVSETGNVDFASGSNVDVSAAAGGDAGKLIVRVATGEFTAANGSVSGNAPQDAEGQRGEGARVDIDSGTLGNFSTLNSALNTGGFDGERRLRVRDGNVDIAATDKVVAKDIFIAADGGKLDVRGELDASGEAAGRIELFAKNDVNIKPAAKLKAKSIDANEDGGDIEIGTRNGKVDLATGSAIDLSGGAGGRGGTLLLRAPRTAGDVNVSALNSAGLDGARAVSIEAVKVYDNVTTLNAGSANGGGTLGLGAIKADNAVFATNHAGIKSRLAQPDIRILSGVEVRSASDLSLDADWNLKDLRDNGEAGVLTLRAGGNLKINNNLSDGFNVATPTSGSQPAILLADKSWSYRLAGGGDLDSADPLATAARGNIELAAGNLIRTGTGDIRIAAGGNIELKDNQAVIYAAGRGADPVTGFSALPAALRAYFSRDGGDITLRAQGDILGQASPQTYSQWLYRQGAIDPLTGNYNKQSAWWVRFDQFRQGIGALGGGDVTLVAGGKMAGVSASTPTQGRVSGSSPKEASLSVTGGGNIDIEAGGDVLGGSYYTGRGEMRIRSGGRVGDDEALKPLLALGQARVRIQAMEEIDVGNVVTPQLLPQAAGNLITALTGRVYSLFSTYSENSAVALESLSGHTAIEQDATRFNGINADWKDSTYLKQYLLPSSLAMTSFQGDVRIGGQTGTNEYLTLNPSSRGGIELLARAGVSFASSLTLSDMDPSLIPNPLRPTVVITGLNNLQAGSGIPRFILDPLKPGETPNSHATAPVHAGDGKAVLVYAVDGDITGINSANASSTTVLNVPKRMALEAGGNVRDLSLHVQNLNAEDVSRVAAGQNVEFDSTPERRDSAQIRIGGPGRLEVTAGKDIDLGTSGGIVSRGRLDNIALSSGGADLRLVAGAGEKGVDYAGTVDRVLEKLQADPADDTTLWLARWLTGNDALTADNAIAAIEALGKMDKETQKTRVVDMLYTALRTTGRDSLDQGGKYAGDYSRGYAALNMVFPRIEEKNADGSFKHYKGDIDLFASRVKTEEGGDIEFMVPGGDVIVGLTNTPRSLIEGNTGTRPDVLGIVVAGKGVIKGFVRDDILVNQSRILTVGGGDLLLWSSEGDIDAGKGKKSASIVPPPVIEFDPATGLVTLRLQGAVSGSGIGALEPVDGTAGDVDLIAPRGTVNAGDAGIRAANLNIAAQVVLGADNITVTGTSTGTPVADTSAITAASSGATTSGTSDMSETVASMSKNLAEAAKAAEELKKSLKPTFISAEVIGHGE